MQKPPSYRHEPKVIINVPRSRSSEPTIVNMPIPKEHRSAITKTRIAVGTAMGLMGIATAVILAKDLGKGSEEKTPAPAATPGILVATAAPSVTNTAEPALEDSAEETEENPIPTATATASPELPKTASALPVTATAAPAKTWGQQKQQPLPKSGIIREVPF